MFNKNIGLLTISVLIMVLASCKKYDGDSYDFSNGVNDYITFTPDQELFFNTETADTVIGTDTLFYYLPDEEPQAVSIETRMAFSEDIQFTYTVTLENGFKETYQGVLPKLTSSVEVEIDLSDVVFPESSDELAGEVELVSASGPTKGNLRIGYPQEGNRTKVSILVLKPYVPHSDE